IAPIQLCTPTRCSRSSVELLSSANCYRQRRSARTGFLRSETRVRTERRRPRHPRPEASQGGVREIAMTRPTSVLTAGVRLILGCLVVGTLAGFSQSRHVAAPPLGYVLGVAFPIRQLPVRRFTCFVSVGRATQQPPQAFLL